MPYSHLPQVYRPDFGLLTDFYQLTMAQAYYQQGIHRRKAVFHLFYRTAPFDGQFAVAAGLPLVLDLLAGMRFSADDVQYLGRQKGADGRALFGEAFLNYLQRLSFSGDLWAIPEGEIVYPHEPILRIEAPLLEAQLIETALLTLINFSSLIATKAARIQAAAGAGGTVLEFGLRRAQGIDGGLTASRAAYLGGCAATSNVWAGRYYGIPVAGTHAHSWIMAFDTEQAAFEAYAKAMPNNTILLVDTYDTITGVKNAIQVARQLREAGHDLIGIRLDSGDLVRLSKDARRLLDQAGLQNTKIVVSDSLDEHRIEQYLADGAPIDIWGVGTRLVTSRDQPALGGVYKLAALEDENGHLQPTIKLSELAIKTSNPARQQVRRYYDRNGLPGLSQIFSPDHGEPPATIMTENGPYSPQHLRSSAASHRDLLRLYVQQGDVVAEPATLTQARETALSNWATYHQIDNLQHGLSPQVAELKQQLRRSLRPNTEA